MTKILIADDESNILMLLEIMLREPDVTILSAQNGDEAFTIAKKEKPDLIISDVVMPKMNGFELCRNVRNEDPINETPIILLSALGDEYNKITGFDEGADDYIIKPFNVEELKARTKTLLAKHQAKQKHSKELSIISENTKLCRTGLDTLDDHLKGGLPAGSNILVVGPTGSGKSSFARNFISSGLLKNEESIVVAIDDDPGRIRQSLTQLSGNTSSYYENEKKLRIVDAYSWSSLSPAENEAFSISGSLELNQLAGIISDASLDLGQSIQEKKGGRRLIDSISSLLVSFELDSVQRFLTQVSRTSIAFGGVTTLFILEEGTVDTKKLNNIKYIMDGVIEFNTDNNQKRCRVSSMKWSSYNNEWIDLKTS